MGKNILKCPIISCSAYLVFLLICSCTTMRPGNNIVIMRGTGVSLGTVSASAVVSENRADGITSGDTRQYGYIDKISNGFSGELNRGVYYANKSKQKSSAPQGAANKAYANAVYDIIRQIRGKGGDGLANVLSEVDLNYDPRTNIETVTVKISADAIKLDKTLPAKNGN